MLITFLLVSSFIFFATIQLFASTNRELALQALSDDRDKSETAIAALRSAGQSGLDELFDLYFDEIKQFRENGNRSESWHRISNAIDRVAMQKNAYAFHLYWFTDLDKVKLASKQTGKPIVSLRLLGNLDEEFSCANSRFFRSLLYSNNSISKALRENYVLHWKSVRPAPRITVDFGDGRKIERTITGNSIHYILDENGTILEALPGLYSPQEFGRYLEIATNLHRSVKNQPAQLKVYHQMRRNQLINKWRGELQTIGVKMVESEISGQKTESSNKKPTALEAVPRAITKMAVELPVAANFKFTLIDEKFLQKETDFDAWQKLANLFGKTTFDQNTIDFIRRQTIGNTDLTEVGFSQMLDALRDSVAMDKVRNEYLFHSLIYKMLTEISDHDVENFNEIVYNNLFLTPRSDKWLGLYSPEVYSALDGNGIVK